MWSSVCASLLLLLLVSAEDFDWTNNQRTPFYYGTFPTGFSWGVGSSAYQTEGAWNLDGKGASIWDVFAHDGKVSTNASGDSSCDGYFKFKDDVGLMKNMKLNHYRFSISWPRILPTGLKDEQINEKGVKYYDDLLNTLLENNITPIVTLYHWDLPQMLQQRFGGWQNSSMILYFNDFANLCFQKFGNRVKHWITFNNPRSVAVEGYETGEHAPGLRLRGTGAYRAAHNIIKAHAAVWQTYDSLWRKQQKGLVGLSLTSEWAEPVDSSDQRDVEAADRFLQFSLGWFLSPLTYGDYPQVMKDYISRKSVGESRLPLLSPQEQRSVRGSCDFVGLGHFTTRYVTHRTTAGPSYASDRDLNVTHRNTAGPSYASDRDLKELVDPLWPDPGSDWLYSVPWGFRRLLTYIRTQYGNPMIFVTENGVSEKMKCTDLCDDWRIQYYRDYINEMLKAVTDGSDVRAFSAWSLLDNLEWNEGFSERFGLFYVDFNDKRKSRIPKASVTFYSRIISSNGFPNEREVEIWKRKSRETCSTSNQLLAADPLVGHMELVTEIVVPTVFTLSILLIAVFLMVLLQRRF